MIKTGLFSKKTTYYIQWNDNVPVDDLEDIPATFFAACKKVGLTLAAEPEYYEGPASIMWEVKRFNLPGVTANVNIYDTSQITQFGSFRINVEHNEKKGASPDQVREALKQAFQAMLALGGGSAHADICINGKPWEDFYQKRSFM